MNKLYVINWALPDGYVFSTSSFWSKEEMDEKIRKNPEWSYEVTEDNATHKIVTAR